MARIRTIKPEFFDDPQIGALSTAAALFFIGLWTQADKAGRLEYDPKRLKLRLLGFRRESAEAMVKELTTGGFASLYTTNGHNYLQIKNFKKHQRPHPKETASVIPAQPCNSTAESGNAGASKLDTGVLESGSLESGVLDSGTLPTAPVRPTPPDPRVKVFLTWFQDEYKTRRHGATYFVNWKKDAAIVKRLLCAYELERLKTLATILLLCDDPWIAGTDRSIGILATKINWLEDWERTWTAKHQSAS